MADDPILVLANSLMVAIENEDKPELTRIFVDAYLDNKLTDLVNLTVRGYDVTPLMHAIRCKADIDIIYKLVNAGADVNEENDKTPLGELLSNVIPRSTTGESRYIMYTVEVFIILLNKGVDVTQKSDGKTPLELARLPHHDQPTARGIYSQQGIIDMIEQRIELEPSLMNLTDKMDNVDEEPLETLVESMKEELSKPRPESSDGKKYLQLLDTCQTYTGLTPLFFMLKHSHPPENLLTFYNLFKENYHPKTTDSGEENILDQTYDTQTPIMIFFTRFNSKTINAYNNPVDLLRNMCEDLKVGKDALTGMLRTGHRSRAEEINKRDMFGLTALDYAEAAGVQEYIDIIKQIHPNAKNGRDFGNISDPNSPFNGRPIKVGILQDIFGNDTPPSTPPHLEDFRVSPAATPGPATPEPATPEPATPGPATPRTPDGSRVSSPSSPPPNIRLADRERSRPPPLMMDLGDSPEPVTPTTPSTPPFSPSLLRTPDTYTPPSSPPPLRGMADDDTPPRMMDLAESPSPAPADPDQIKRFFDAIKANNISDTRDVMQEAFFQNNLEALVSSTDPENAVLKKPPMVVAAESIVEYELFLLLVYNGVDINATSSDGQGPLHYLADMTNPDYLTFTLSLTNSLINQGANVFMKDNNGKTALDIALEALHEIPESNRHATFKLIIKEIEDRMDKKVQEPFQELRNIIDNVDEDPIEKVLEDLRKLPLDDYIVGLEDSQGLNSLMYAIKYFAEPQHLISIYDFITSIDDLMELTFKGKTAPMVFLDKYPNYNSDTADFFSVLCSNVPDINHQDLFGLTVLDYAEKTGAQEYIDIVLKC
jgi:ankyrin repeat protein